MGIHKTISSSIYATVAVLFFFLNIACSNDESNKVYLVLGKTANEIEINTINDFKVDLQKVTDKTILVISEGSQFPKNGTIFVLGTTESNQVIGNLVKEGLLGLSKENPGPRGGIWSKSNLESGQNAIILAGSNVQGMQYAVYDYAEEVLGIDPLAYWTGKIPNKIDEIDLFAFESKTIAPPKVPILCYFENDVDELASYRGKLLEYDWESYTEMINSLVKLRYNAIQFFDMLGRPEFYLRPEYQELHPDYQIDIPYLEKMMDYAHSKGMKIQVDFSLGYQIHPMDEEKASCWADYKEDWIKAWRYYFEETPLAKTDIFILRPRNQVWDWEYKSSCGEDKIEVFNEVFTVFDDLVDSYKNDATKALICYSDAMQMYNDGFRPPKDWIIAWADDGFGDFEHLPQTTDDYTFGTYMHAGFWLNHTVHNPYPEKVEAKMKKIFNDYGAYEYCMVNGQNFRPFIFNIEAYSDVCQNPDTFSAEQYYEEWSHRYFDKNTAVHAVKSMKLLNKAQSSGRIGYVQHLWEIREAIAYLSNSPIERPGKPPVPYEFERVENDLEHVRFTKKHIDSALTEAKKGLKLSKEDGFYYSYVYLPTLLYSDLMLFESNLHQMSLLKRKYETSSNVTYLKEALVILEDAKKNLAKIYQNRLEGDKNPKWEKWYDPAIRRPNNGFPTQEMLNQVERNVTQITKI
nr:glycosyl hydrolase 115 family protein [uncultured Allomuricauda sp.]